MSCPECDGEIEALTKRARKHASFAHLHQEAGERSRPATLVLVDVADISLAILEALSEEFGTKLIDVECDRGTGSDPCHEREIYIRERTK